MAIIKDPFTQLAILTPSRITTAQRHTFASDSIASLSNSLQGVPVSHVVVHDSPVLKKFIPKTLQHLVDQLRWDARAKEVYDSPDLTWVSGDGLGSASAMLSAVNVALSMNKIFGFIHLDDHVYDEGFGELLGKGLKAMGDQPNLLWTRYSGYPVMYKNKSPIIPNDGDQIVFDGVKLSANRTSEYTLWSSPLIEDVNNGCYWPIALWFCIYRLSSLKIFLEWAIARKKKHLAHVELYFKNQGGFQKLMNEYPDGIFGYINMQFGGIEMHRNTEWRELLAMPNDAVI